MARQRLIDNQNNAAAHPLLERGGRRPGCVAPAVQIQGRVVSHRQTATIRGVSHHQTATIRCVSHRQTSTNVKKYTVLLKYLKTNKINQASSLCHNCLLLRFLQGHLRSLSDCCPIVVRLLSVRDWTTTGQQLDNERTTTSVDPVKRRSRNGDLLWGSRVKKCKFFIAAMILFYSALSLLCAFL